MDHTTVKDVLMTSLVSIRQEFKDRFLCSCPFAKYKHRNGTDNNPSCWVYTNDIHHAAGFVCYACKEKGSIFHLINLIYGLRGHPIPKKLNDFIEYYQLYLPEINFDSIFEEHIDLLPIDYHILSSCYEDLSPEAIEYLINPPKYIKHNPINFWIDALKYDPDEERILFPVCDIKDNFYGYTGRTINESVTPKVRDYSGLPKKHLVLGECFWERGKPVILVEGLFDYLNIMQHYIDEFNVGCLMGSYLSPSKASKILDMDAPVYVLADKDIAGDQLVQQCVQYLEPNVPLFLPDYPNEKNDPGELTRDEIHLMLNAHSDAFQL